MSRDIRANHVEYSNEPEKERQTQEGKLLFTKIKGKQCAALIKGARLLAVSTVTEQSERVGAFYIAKIRKVVPNLNACFVEIAGGEICFLPLKEARHFFRCSQPGNCKNMNTLCQGDEILVQIIREAQKNKQATVTAQISLTNDAFVIGIGSNKVGYSSKFTKEEKAHFKMLLEQNGFVHSGIFSVPQDTESEIKNYLAEIISETGMVVRTLAAQLSDELFLQSAKKILAEYLELLVTARHRICFSCVREPLPAFAAVIEKMVSPDEYREIVTDDPLLYEKLKAYEETRVTEKNVRFYQDEMLSLSKLYALETKLDEAMQEKVWLKSGAYLVIQPTEALTVIDVNSGKNESGGDDADYAFRINEEAANEIALQLRLRNISGIIIVDFINMSQTDQKEKLLEHMRALAKTDKTTCVAVDLTSLSLMELTRKKDQKPLYEAFKN